ncbi:glycosyltransferase family 2 protein [Sphingobacterium multivorum]|uniref:Glycosyltransferase family 2 protein n=1 Tax=Sphingobacterium multivorum TaxID=28454 RepID=A0ABX7CQ12_SPHMU|nr:glycosyltransferase family 2 protein [Sphingobacterium multivorum]QQT29863.1 glycosyltransferase family 2 protein [Sphingobacterium multivorum]QQT54165.1 glycosyltransferase family 2 protein [Sphingobacterium multivorum]
MSKLPKVAVVILNWNGRFFLEKFLPSVYNSSYPNVEFVIGDNASDDDSISFVKQYYPTITILENDKNYGFAGGYNKILQRVDADYYVLLNSDVEVSQNWIEPVIEYLERNPSLAAAQPKIRSFHDKQKFEHAGAAGGYLDYFGFPFCQGRILHEVEDDAGQYDNESEIFWASGAALFIRSDAWKEADGLDEDFFAHMEEIDLCWRLKKMGYGIGYCPKSIVYHVGGGTLNASNPKKTYLNFRNNMVMLQKNLPLGKAIWIIFIRLWFDFAALAKFLIDRKPKDAWAISRAHQYFFLNIFKNAKKRKKYKVKENTKGQYKKSIIIDFYTNNKHKFSQLNPEDFK